MRSNNNGFVIGFLLGFVGGCMGLIVAPLFGREYLTGAVVGFGVSMVTGMLLGGFMVGLGDLASAPVDGGGLETAPIGTDGLRRINPDGSPMGAGPVDGLPLGLIAAAVGGLGVSVLAMFGAFYALFSGGGNDERELRHQL
jgi:hypothetical protein